MQILHHADLASMAASGGLNLVRDNPSSDRFSRACGFYLPVYPPKGYSITVAPAPGAPVLRHSVTDMERKLVFAPLARDAHTAIRIARIADLERNNTAIDARRIDILRRASAELLGIDAAATSSRGAGFI